MNVNERSSAYCCIRHTTQERAQPRLLSRGLLLSRRSLPESFPRDFAARDFPRDFAARDVLPTFGGATAAPSRLGAAACAG